jgi:hypothetical protein
VKNSGDNVFEGIAVGPEEAALVNDYLGAHDFAANSRRAVVNDLRKFAAWFSGANAEPFRVGRVTTRDVTRQLSSPAPISARLLRPVASSVEEERLGRCRAGFRRRSGRARRRGSIVGCTRLASQCRWL